MSIPTPLVGIMSCNIKDQQMKIAGQGGRVQTYDASQVGAHGVEAVLLNL